MYSMGDGAPTIVCVWPQVIILDYNRPCNGIQGWVKAFGREWDQLISTDELLTH